MLSRRSHVVNCLDISLCAALALCTFPTRAFAQDNKPAIQEPQYEAQIEVIEADGSLVPLEQQKLLAKGRATNYVIVQNYSAAYTVPGPSSPVRVTPAARFAVRVPASAANLDPATLMFLKPFTVTKDKRSLSMGNARTGFAGIGHKEEDAKEDSIPISFSKYGANSLEITPKQPLAPGEYVIEVPNLGMMGFCFGVDPK